MNDNLFLRSDGPHTFTTMISSQSVVYCGERCSRFVCPVMLPCETSFTLSCPMPLFMRSMASISFLCFGHDSICLIFLSAIIEYAMSLAPYICLATLSIFVRTESSLSQINLSGSEGAFSIVSTTSLASSSAPSPPSAKTHSQKRNEQ